MDTERPDEHGTDDVVDAAVDGVDATGVAYGDPFADPAGAVEAVEPVAAPKSRLLLGALAGLGVVLVAVGAWVGLFLATDRDFPGVTVVAALVIGYVVREVSRRSDLLPRVVSALLAAILCVVGSVATATALVVDAPGVEASFLDTFGELLPHAFAIVNDRDGAAMTWIIFAAAVVVAFMSAAPAKPKRTKATPATAEPAGEATALGDEG